MSRLRPANLRQTSSTLNFYSDGLSNYYYNNQLKQNLANSHVIKLIGQTLLFPVAPVIKRHNKLPLLQPANLPISLQLRARKAQTFILAHSRRWFVNKTRDFVSALMTSALPKFFERIVGFTNESPCKTLTLVESIAGISREADQNYTKQSATYNRWAKETRKQRANLRLVKFYKNKSQHKQPINLQQTNKTQSKKVFLAFALGLISNKTYNHKTKGLINTSFTSLNVTKQSHLRLRRQRWQARYYDFKFLRQLNSNVHVKLDAASPISKLSYSQTGKLNKLKKGSPKDTWLILNATYKHALQHGLRHGLRPSKVPSELDNVINKANLVLRSRDVPRSFHPACSLDTSKIQQKGIDTVNPLFATVGRFNRPLALCLFTFIAGGFPAGILQRYNKKASIKKPRSKTFNSKKISTNKLLARVKQKPMNHGLRYSDTQRIGLAKLNTALRFDLTLDLDNDLLRPSLRPTLSVRL